VAAYHARSNVCRAGVTYAGLANRTFGLTIGGSNRLQDSRAAVGFSLTKPLDGSSSTLTLTAGGTKPAEGADIVLTLGGELLFGGTVQRVRSIQEQGGTLMSWNLAATDWWWLLNRYARVTGRFVGGINTVVAKLLATYTDGGFLPGYLPQSLGDIDVTFDGERVGDAIKRIAKAANGGAGAFVRITPYKRIDIATSFPDGISLSLVNATDYHQVTVESILDQVRTRVQARGVGTQTTVVSAPSSTTLSVEEVGIFPASGSAWVPSMGAIAYTGRSATSGPGALTGVTGITADIPQGSAVQVFAQADDSSAQTALASTLGGGRSGVAVEQVANDAWTYTESAAQASARLALLKTPQSVLNVMAVAVPAAKVFQHEVGAIVAANVTSPQTISGDYRIQRVVIGPWSSLAETEPRFTVTVDAKSTVGVDLFDILGTMS